MCAPQARVLRELLWCCGGERPRVEEQLGRLGGAKDLRVLDRLAQLMDPALSEVGCVCLCDSPYVCRKRGNEGDGS